MAADFNFEAYLNGSSDASVGFNTDIFREVLTLTRRWIVAVVIGCVATFLIWCILTPKYMRIHRVNLESWLQLLEYPIINHARYIIKVYYSVVVILNLVVICAIAYMLYNLNGTGLILLVLCIIPMIVMGIFGYIVTLFGQVYQVMIALELYNGYREQNTNVQFAQEQTSRRKRIRNLYLLFLARDFLLRPILGFITLSGSKSTADLVAKASNPVSLSIVVGMLINMIIQLLVPIVVIMRIGAKPTNPLQRLMFTQAKVITVFQLAALISCGILFLMNVMSLQSLPSVLQMSGIPLPLIIQATTVLTCKGSDKECDKVDPMVAKI